MLGIVLNIIAFIIIGFMGANGVGSMGLFAFLAIVVFLLISFGFTISQSARAESDNCFYSLLMIANMIFSGIMLFALLGAFAMQCGCA